MVRPSLSPGLLASKTNLSEAGILRGIAAIESAAFRERSRRVFGQREKLGADFDRPKANVYAADRHRRKARAVTAAAMAD